MIYLYFQHKTNIHHNLFQCEWKSEIAFIHRYVKSELEWSILSCKGQNKGKCNYMCLLPSYCMDVYVCVKIELSLHKFVMRCMWREMKKKYDDIAVEQSNGTSCGNLKWCEVKWKLVQKFLIVVCQCDVKKCAWRVVATVLGIGSFIIICCTHRPSQRSCIFPTWCNLSSTKIYEHIWRH